MARAANLFENCRAWNRAHCIHVLVGHNTPAHAMTVKLFPSLLQSCISGALHRMLCLKNCRVHPRGVSSKGAVCAAHLTRCQSNLTRQQSNVDVILDRSLASALLKSTDLFGRIIFGQTPATAYLRVPWKWRSAELLASVALRSCARGASTLRGPSRSS